ncbi:MAG: L,D-transpeptidase family protein [Chitinophagaceae bacterium]|nr:L,D-transpeptidase family protein [Chitinophagaceae bacterium]
MKKIILFFLLFSLSKVSIFAQPLLQPQYPDYSFQSAQLNAERVNAALKANEGKLKNLFLSKGLKYPCSNILFRGFKAINEMELWGRNSISDTFTHIKTYKVCALSGILGPKRWEGDRQVPEGMYFIQEFNPRSEYHLSLLLNYPNYSDMFFSNKEQPGGKIYIHGGCVTVGCLPMTNEFIEEIYSICVLARTNGEMNIPVQIYPIRYDEKSLNFIGREYKDETEKQKFWINLKQSFDYFEANKKTLPVMYDENGNYIF